MLWFFGYEACGVLAPQPGIKPIPSALEGIVLTLGLSRHSFTHRFLKYQFLNKHLHSQLHRFLEFWKVDDLAIVLFFYLWLIAFPGGSDGKESAGNTGDPGSIPESGRSPGEGNGNPLQNSCLENSMDKGAWMARVHGLLRVRHDWAIKTFTFHLWRMCKIWK